MACQCRHTPQPKSRRRTARQRAFTGRCCTSRTTSRTCGCSNASSRAGPGVTLVSAMQGSRGVELARAHRPDLIILDLHLPDMPGADVLVRLLADPTTKAIPVVILSADATPGRISRLLEQGARAYLTKPLDVRELLSLIDDTLRNDKSS